MAVSLFYPFLRLREVLFDAELSHRVIPALSLPIVVLLDLFCSD